MQTEELETGHGDRDGFYMVYGLWSKRRNAIFFLTNVCARAVSDEKGEKKSTDEELI